MLRVAMWLLLVLVILAVGYGLGTVTGPRVQEWYRPSSENGQAPASLPLYRTALGKIQPRGGIINIGGLPGDRVRHLYVQQGNKVKQGDPLVEFFSHAERKREVELASKQVLAARLRLDAIDDAERAKLAELDQQGKKAEVSANLKVDVEGMQLPALREQTTLAQRVYESLRDLDPTRASVSAQNLQKARAEFVAARARLDAAEAQRKAAKSQLTTEKATLEKMKAAAKAEFALSRATVGLEMLQQQEELAKLRLERSLVKAERDGVVLRILAQEGDTLGQEPVLQLASVNEMIVVAEVYANDVQVLSSWLKTPDTKVAATMTSGALEKDLHGRLTNRLSIARIVARNSLSGFSARADADRRIIDVRIDLDEASAAQAQDYIGLEVNVTFKPEPPPKP